MRFARWRDGAWSDPVTLVVSEALVANWADFPRPAVGGDGAIYVHYLRFSNREKFAYDAVLLRSTDGGSTFVDLGTIHRDGTESEHGFVSMAPVPGGVRLFWLDGRATATDGGAMQLFTALASESVREARPLDRRVCDCCQTDAAVGDEGPLVVYRDRDEAEHRDIALVRQVGKRFSPPTLVRRDRWRIAGCPVNGPAVAARGRRVAVAWFTGADGGSARLALSRDGGASFGAPIVIDGQQPVGRVDLALLDDGVAVSWLARTRRGGEVKVRFVGWNGALGEPVKLASTSSGRASGFPVLARDGDALVVGWRDGDDPPRLRAVRLPASALPRTAGRARPAADMEGPTLRVGERAPEEARLLLADGQQVGLAAIADGRPLLLAFFARWCQPCREELALLEQAVRRLGDRAVVVAVGLDEGPHARVEATARRWGFSGPVARDAGAAAALGVPPIPAMLLFGSDGTLLARHQGKRPDLAEILAPLEAPTPPSSARSSSGKD